VSDRPQYPSYPGDDADGADPHAPQPGTSPGDLPPAYGQPPYGQPAYGQPAYGRPAYGQPAYGRPAYGQAPVPGAYQPGHAPASTKAVFGLVLGIVSILFCYLGVLIGPAAIALSVMAGREIDASPHASGRGLATGGLVTGIIGTVIWGLLSALTIIGMTVE
jgi:hypothetical protein